MRKIIDLISYNRCSPIKDKESFATPSLLQRFQICPEITILQLLFVNCIINYTADYRCMRKKSLHNQISEQNYRGVDYSFQNLIEMYNNLRFKA